MMTGHGTQVIDGVAILCPDQPGSKLRRGEVAGERLAPGDVPSGLDGSPGIDQERGNDQQNKQRDESSRTHLNITS